MSKFYENSIIPKEVRRKYDVYERISELGIDLGTSGVRVALTNKQKEYLFSL